MVNWSSNSKWWKLKWRRLLLSRELIQEIWLLISPVHLNEEKRDLLVWTCDSKGLFPVKACNHLVNSVMLFFWVKSSTSKVEAFTWLTALDRLSTRDFFAHRGNLCCRGELFPFWCLHNETLSHVMLRCHGIWLLWDRIMSRWGCGLNYAIFSWWVVFWNGSFCWINAKKRTHESCQKDVRFSLLEELSSCQGIKLENVAFCVGIIFEQMQLLLVEVNDEELSLT